MRGRGRPRGAALLLVLWVVVLLTGVVTLFATAARTEGMQGRTLARATAARYAAEAGLEVAAMHLQGIDLRARWLPDGRAQRFSFDGHRIEVRVVDESAKIDLNAAPTDVLSGLFVALQVDPDRARALAGAIIDWRDPDNLLAAEGGAEDSDYAQAGLPYGAKDRPFDTVSELRQVLGMDAATFERARPYLTVYTGQARPSPNFAARPVLQAIGMTPEQVAVVLAQRGETVPGQPAPLPGQTDTLAAQGTGTYSISSQATRADGTRVRIQAAIRIGAGGGSGQLYLPLSWRVGETD
jgi:general secretion pathway protein K